MLVYLLIDLIIILIGIYTYDKTKKNWALVVTFLMLVFFAGFRGDFTSDYQSYADYFTKTVRHVSVWKILKLGTSFSMEKGFVLICKLVGFVSKSPVFFFTLFSAMTLGLYYAGFKKLSAMPVLTVLLFVGVGDYYATYNLMRQMFAVALVFLGMNFFSEGKTWKYILCVLVAVTFHRTALIMLPLTFLFNRKVCTRNILIYCGVAAVFMVLLPSVVGYMQLLFAAYGDYSYGLGEGTINAVIPQLGMIAFVAYSIFSKSCDFDLDNKKNRMLVNVAILAILMQCLGLRIYIVSRLAYYCKPAFWILIPNIIDSYKKEQDRRIALVIISLLSIAYTWITISGTGYEPYYFIGQR